MKHTLSFPEKLGVIWVYLGRRAKLWLRFKISFVFSFIAMFVTIAIFYFMSLFVGSVQSDYYNGPFFTFVLIGLAVNQYMQTTLNVYLNTMHSIYWSNRLEIVLTSPMRLKTFFSSVMTWTYLYATMNVVFYFIIGIFVFGAEFTFPATAWIVIPILILLIISLSGIGLISASMFMLVNAKGDIEPIGWGVATISGLVAGVYFPPKYLPVPVQLLSKILPQTYAIDAIRRVLLNGEGISSPSIQLTIVYLIVFSIILLPLGMFMFNIGIRKAEKEGTLARWM
ncbi:MAG: ABC transporter permease [Candidatus Thermoplasmatota archaeon]|nr:ABC transporter permease [Candidatus Thermoplasmatota archaeon]